MKRIWDSIAEGIEPYGPIIGILISIAMIFGLFKLINMMGNS